MDTNQVTAGSTKQVLDDVIVVYRDGTSKRVRTMNAWEYEADPDYLVTISLDPLAYPSEPTE